MSTVPCGDAGDAVERLQREQWHILELFDGYARSQRAPAPRVYEAGRLAALIYTLLRVHGELEAMLLRARDAAEPACAAHGLPRRQVIESLRRAEALSPHDPAHVQQMATLARHVCAWFRQDENELFAWARSSRLDLGALDQEMATEQQRLLEPGWGPVPAGAPTADVAQPSH